MSNPKNLIFNLLSEDDGYAIYYAIPKHNLDIGKCKTIMFVMKDDEIVYLPNTKRSQFHMKKECDEYIKENKDDSK